MAAAWLVRADGLPRHILLFIGDGMGEGQIAAARAWLGRPLVFETYPWGVLVATESASGLTDSAASSTAISTGRRVGNGVISRALPGTGEDLRTLGERMIAAGRRVGLVTTSYLLDATPAAFIAHANHRSDWSAIVTAYLATNGPHLLLGGGAGLSTGELATAGYRVAVNSHEMWSAVTGGVGRLAGVFGAVLPYEIDGLGELPGLEEMTRAALEWVVRQNAPSFLVIEAGRIDHACHANDLMRCVGEMWALDQAVAAASAWAESRGDVLIVVAADHETGGLRVIENRGAGQLPVVSWSTTGHTSAPIRAFASGSGADRLLGVRHLVDFCAFLSDPVFPAPEIHHFDFGAEGGRLRWLAVSGRVYEVEWTTSFLSSAWVAGPTITAAWSGVAAAPFGTPHTSRVFYRIRQLWPLPQP
ncbi:MAG: alkaline phosphatase [Kiritimatiellae bacterium]|nr:alkaline phosphatase [Kiritimatiellia bacterium]